jgi:hypothetical protein
VNDAELEKISKFEERMEVLGKDSPSLAKACRHAHTTIRAAKHVAESVFNDDVADNPEIVMQIHAAIADDLDDIKDDQEEGGEEFGE